MDVDQIKDLGTQPLANFLSEIGGWSITPSNFDEKNWNFQEQVTLLHTKYNMGGLFSVDFGLEYVQMSSAQYYIKVST